MQNGKVSVISSLYNSEPYLRNFLENCLEQTWFHNSEYIFNFSKISIEEKHILTSMKKYFGHRLRIIDNSNRIGIYQSWNECLRLCTGTMIAIWNVDDIRTRESLEIQAQLMMQANSLSIAGPFTVVQNYGNKFGVEIKLPKSSNGAFYRSMLHGPFFMFRRDTLKRLRGFDEQLESASDFDFCVRLANCGPVAITKENLGFYLNSGIGMSTSKRTIIAAEREFVYQRYGAFDKLDPSYLHLTRRWDLNRIRVLGKQYALDTVVKNLDEILETNNRDNEFSAWISRLNREMRQRRIRTAFFYAKKPSNFFNEVKRRLSSANGN